jgi:protein SCO1/2|tara:strand:- start:2945 stop:3550 length:606 start_codon:yes stop_codon:yes gene_type:complete
MKSTLLFLPLLLIPNLRAEELPPCCAVNEVSVDAAGSVYELDARWTDQHDQQTQLADFKGQPVLLTMGYSSCQYACPRLVADLIAIKRELTATQQQAVRFVFVSIDPERDSPEKLAAFFDQYDVDQSRWSGLRGSDDAVLELSVALGTRYRQLENLDFAHSNRLTLLSPEGVIVHNQEGLGTDPSEMLGALRNILTTAERD